MDCPAQVWGKRMILRIGTALGNCEQEEVLKSHLIRIAIEEDCELDIADYRKELSKLWSAFTDLDLVFLDYALLRGGCGQPVRFFPAEPGLYDCSCGNPERGDLQLPGTAPGRSYGGCGLFWADPASLLPVHGNGSGQRTRFCRSIPDRESMPFP